MTCVFVGGYFLIKRHGISVTWWNGGGDFVYSSLIQLNSKVLTFIDSFLLIKNGPESNYVSRRGMMVLFMPLLSAKFCCGYSGDFCLLIALDILSNSLTNLQSVSFHCICSSCSGVPYPSSATAQHHSISFWCFLLLQGLECFAFVCSQRKTGK